MVELFATVVALHTFRERLVGSWSLLLVDSEGALKGYSAREDLCELVGVLWNIALELRVQLTVYQPSSDTCQPSRSPVQRSDAGRY